MMNSKACFLCTVCGEWKHSKVKHEEGLTVQLKARVSKVDCSALIDTGASHSIIDANFVAKAGLRALRAKKILRATIPGNTTITLNRVVTVPVTIGNMHSTNTFYVMDRHATGRRCYYWNGLDGTT
jgi:hypothetical protein